MHPNTMKNTKTWVYGPMGWIGCVRCEKSGRGFVTRTFVLIAPVLTVLHRVSCSYETITNAPKNNETYENMSLGSNGWIWCVHCEKSRRDFVAWTFALICTSSPCFASSFKQLRNDPKCTQTQWNTPKHEFTVQCGGSGAFVAKNYNVTSWHGLLH